MKPVIGILCKKELIPENYPFIANRTIPFQYTQYILQDYVDSIQQAGGIPVAIPVYNDLELAKQMVSRVEGILFAGGSDVAPSYYGENMAASCGNLALEQDAQDLELARFLLQEMDLPILGICRGMQVLNVSIGGKLYQVLYEQKCFGHHQCFRSPGTNPVHAVNVKTDSLLYSILGKKQVSVNSYHHQGIKQVASALKETACAEDGLVEALEYPAKRFVLGVQWHPEMMHGSEVSRKIFGAFVGECKAR